MAAHNGTDYGAPAGTPVKAPESGDAVSSVDSTGYGNLVTIRGDSGWQHKLAHLQRFGKLGRVNEGDVVGYVDSTGFSTGHHLHWGTRPPRYNQNNGYYGSVDPQIFLNEQKGVSSLPYSDEQYNALLGQNQNNKAAAVNGLYWRYMGRGASEPEVRTWLGVDVNELENRLRNPDDPTSEEHRQQIVLRFKRYFGRGPSDSEIRQRTPQNLIEVDREFEDSEEHRQKSPAEPVEPVLTRFRDFVVSALGGVVETIKKWKP